MCKCIRVHCAWMHRCRVGQGWPRAADLRHHKLSAELGILPNPRPLPGPLLYFLSAVGVVSFAKSVNSCVVLDIVSRDFPQGRMSKCNACFQILGNGQPCTVDLQALAVLRILPTRQYVQLWKRKIQGRDHLLCRLKIIDCDDDQARIAHTQALQHIRLPCIPVKH